MSNVVGVDASVDLLNIHNIKKYNQNNYISKIENKDNSKIIINKDKKDKYTKLKKYSIAITVLCIIQTLIIIFWNKKHYI